jgi:flagellar protein FlaI
MATGHLGMSTIHAESVEAVINRLESEPMNIPKPLIAMTDVIMVMARTEIEEKPARRAITTTEVLELDRETKRIPTEEVFTWNPREDKFAFSGHSSLLEGHMQKMGVTKTKVKHELRCRKIILEWMVRKGVRRYTDVANVIREYYANPKRVYQKARVGLK